jgi:DNA-binding transcriptional ArsR family regulator
MLIYSYCDGEGIEAVTPRHGPRVPARSLGKLAPEALALIAKRFGALAEPRRLQILQALLSAERNVGELTGLLETTQPNVSRHLRVLQDAGFVGRRAEGNSAYWFVTDPAVAALCGLVCDRLEAGLATQARLMAHRR